MKKSLLLLLCAFSFAVSAFAQTTGELKLKLFDSKTNNAIVGATVALTDNDKKTVYKSSNGDGSSSFTSLASGSYELMATFLGYDTLRRTVAIDGRILDLGNLTMATSSVKLERVEINAMAIRTSQSGDTVIYNADAYKVSADAAVEGLLAKMPGITVDDDGEVEAQGEAVQKVYLDGKEFFGEDVALAVKNIPADIIAKVEVFNKLSDNAEFTGFDDGDSYKALNFVTKNGMNSGHFGKFTAGYAHENLYQVSANYNYFRENHRITVIGGYNNMNIRNFGQMDLVGSGRRGGGGGKGGGGRSISGGGSFTSGSSGKGLATIGSIGINYGGSFLEEKLKIEGSYFYNLSDSENIKTTDAQYVTEEGDPLSYFDTYSNSGSDNYNHRVNLKFEYKPNTRHSLMMRPEFSFQDTGSDSYSFTDYTEAEDATATAETVSTKLSTSDTEKMAYNISNNIVYRALIGDKGRNIMFMANGRYSINDSDAYKLTDNTVMAYEDSETGESYGTIATITDYNVLDETKSYTINSSVMYSEPIMEKSAMLTLKYTINHQYSDANYLLYSYDDDNDLYSVFDADGSNVYNSKNTTQSVTAGFMYSKKNFLTLNANVSVQRTRLINEQEYPEATPDGDYTFDHLMYSFTMRKTFNPTNSLRLTLRSKTSNPSITDLQDVLVDTDPNDIAYGNSSLAPSYAHSLSANYNRSNIMMGRTFSANINASLTNDYIGEETIQSLDASSSTTVVLPDGNTASWDGIGTYERPVNLDGMWSVSAGISYGTPVNLFSSNLNLDAGISYGESPNLISYDGGDVWYDNTKTSTTYKAGITLGSNISQNVDFTLAYSGSYSITDYRNDYFATNTNRNDYVTNTLRGNFKFVFLGGFTFTGNATYTYYAGITDDFDEHYIMCNLSLGHKVCKNNRGELSVGVNDLFNNSESFTRTYTSTYNANVYSNTIGRYYGIKFVYDLRKFKGNVTESTFQRGNDRPERGMGGPGGMGRM
ncbi:MAG: outer membrane beta-barrel protein [Rikenellaceae bacterium]